MPPEVSGKSAVVLVSKEVQACDQEALKRSRDEMEGELRAGMEATLKRYCKGSQEFFRLQRVYLLNFENFYFFNFKPFISQKKIF